jgi:N-acetyl-anhydromuramoyl-L-alanine amidase
VVKIGIENHWLIGARRTDSPNQDVRPIPASEIDLLVIHSISLPPGAFGRAYIEKFFCNQLDRDAHSYFGEISDLRVSAHLLIYRSGERVQFVPFDQRAWHAGESQYQGRSSCNDFSVGIELEGTDQTPYTDTQYVKLVEVTQSLFRSYPRLLPERIVGHGDIAPGRKTDPGASFDWTRYRSLLQRVAGK